MTKTERVLRFIGRAKDKGRSFTEIQRYIVEDLNGKDFDEPPKTYPWHKDIPRTNRKRRYRGYWCDRLLGGLYSNGGEGLLHSYCKKNDAGKWVLCANLKHLKPPFTKGWGLGW